MSQYAAEFKPLDAELSLARALLARTGRDLFQGVTDRKDRQAAARIAIVMNRLEGEFGRDYQTIYGEPLPERRRVEPSEPKQAKGK